MKKKQVVAMCLACCCVLVLFAAGCAPKSATPEEGGQSKAVSKTTVDLGYPNFTERSTGLFPDVQDNAQYQNTGNRGCNACHADLTETVLGVTSGDYAHIINKVGYEEKAGTVYDCLSCHYGTAATTGFAFSDIIHTNHYSSQAFLETEGNCWSCHALTAPKVPGEGEFNIGRTLSDQNGGYNTSGKEIERSYKPGGSELVLFEDLMYSPALGGYPNNGTSPSDVWWLKMRGWDTGYASGASVDADPQFTVDMNQNDSDEKDDFVIENFAKADHNDVYTNEDWMASWKLSVKGVAQEGEITLDELKAMKTTDVTYGHWCIVNGINGDQVVNKPYTGVLLKDFVEARGGLTDPTVNGLTISAVDGWKGGPNAAGYKLQALMDDGAILAWANWGHDMTAAQGGPVALIIPSVGGGPTVKMLQSLEFTHLDNPFAPGERSRGSWYPVFINSVWLADDGIQGKVGQEMVIPSVAYGAYGAAFQDTKLDRVEFSFDYGNTWQKVAVPEGSDPYRATFYDFKWTPKEAGTYVLKSRAVSGDDVAQKMDSSIIVTVSE